MLMEAIAMSLQINDPQPSGEHENVENDKVPLPVSHIPKEAFHTTQNNDANIRQSSVPQSSSTVTSKAETQNIGTLEAFGQRWGLGLFRATSNKDVNNEKS